MRMTCVRGKLGLPPRCTATRANRILCGNKPPAGTGTHPPEHRSHVDEHGGRHRAHHRLLHALQRGTGGWAGSGELYVGAHGAARCGCSTDMPLFRTIASGQHQASQPASQPARMHACAHRDARQRALRLQRPHAQLEVPPLQLVQQRVGVLNHVWAPEQVGHSAVLQRG